MAFIQYAPESGLTEGQKVADKDNIIQIHRVHPEVMRLHYDLYLELMHRPGPLTRAQREMVGVAVSIENGCDY